MDSVSVLKELSKKYKPNEWDYYISTLFPVMFEHLEFIDKIIPYNQLHDDVFAMEGIGNHKGYFDMAFHPASVRTNLDYFKNNY